MKCLWPPFSAAIGIPQHALRRLRDRPSGVVGELDARTRDDRHLLVAEKHHVARVAQNRGNVGGDEELVLAEPDDDRRPVADRDDLLRVLDGDEHNGEHSAHDLQRAAHRLLEAVVAHLALDQMRDDLGVGLGLELVALPLKLLLQLQVVLDDAVVHDDNPARAVAVRVGVLLGGTAVSGPSGMTDAVQPVNRLVADGDLEVGQLACRSAERDAFRADQRHARRVVAAIFHAPQAVEQDRHDGFRADVSDDSAHSFRTPTTFFRRTRPLPTLRPAVDVVLAAASDPQGSGGDVLGDR